MDNHGCYGQEIPFDTIMVFFSNWLVGSIMVLALVLLFWPLVTALRERHEGMIITCPAVGRQSDLSAAFKP